MHFGFFIFELEDLVELILELFHLVIFLVEVILIFLLNLLSLGIEAGSLLVQFGFQSLLLRFESFFVVVGFLALFLGLLFLVFKSFRQVVTLVFLFLVLYAKALHLALHTEVALMDLSILAGFICVCSSVELFVIQSVCHR